MTDRPLKLGKTMREIPINRTPEPDLLSVAEQADAYIRHCVDTGNPINADAVPLLRLREAIDIMRQQD